MPEAAPGDSSGAPYLPSGGSGSAPSSVSRGVTSPTSDDVPPHLDAVHGEERADEHERAALLDPPVTREVRRALRGVDDAGDVGLHLRRREPLGRARRLDADRRLVVERCRGARVALARGGRDGLGEPVVGHLERDVADVIGRLVHGDVHRGDSGVGRARVADDAVGRAEVGARLAGDQRHLCLLRLGADHADRHAALAEGVVRPRHRKEAARRRGPARASPTCSSVSSSVGSPTVRSMRPVGSSTKAESPVTWSEGCPTTTSPALVAEPSSPHAVRPAPSRRPVVEGGDGESSHWPA